MSIVTPFAMALDVVPPLSEPAGVARLLVRIVHDRRRGGDDQIAHLGAERAGQPDQSHLGHGAIGEVSHGVERGGRDVGARRERVAVGVSMRDLRGKLGRLSWSVRHGDVGDMVRGRSAREQQHRWSEPKGAAGQHNVLDRRAEPDVELAR